MTRRWTSTPILKASAALHAAAALSTLAMPTAWPLTLAAVLGNHAALTLAGLLPRSTLLGPNLTRLPTTVLTQHQVALTLDDGPDPQVTPRVLDLLDTGAAKASFFCIGQRARQHPALCREIVARGHRVENHGDAHSNAFSLFGPTRMHADISAAQATLSDITGQAPLFFRPTAGLRNPFLQPVLTQLELRLVSWTRRAYDTREGRAQQVLQRLSHGLAAGDILLMHDGHGARAPDGQPVILTALPLLLQAFALQGLQPVTLKDALT